MKKLGRAHRPFFRVCAMDVRAPRDGRVIEELGYYDPMVAETDARAILDGERIAYWLGVGAQPTEKVRVLIKKYGKDGTHLDKQKAALERAQAKRDRAKTLGDAAAERVKTKEQRQQAQEEAAAEGGE
jgi:small subunit ribosomal protein S16